MRSRLPMQRLMSAVKRQGIIDNRLGLVNTFSSSKKATKINAINEDDFGGSFEIGKSIIGGNDRVK